jgi:superfamily II DNA/RNA helicase
MSFTVMSLTFEELGMSVPLLAALHAMKLHHPSAVQAAAIPPGKFGSGS